jgi:hypothetical protein
LVAIVLAVVVVMARVDRFSEALNQEGNNALCASAVGSLQRFCTAGGGAVNMNTDSLNVQKRLFFGSPGLKTNPDWGDNNSDPYFIEKVVHGTDGSSLRLTMNDNRDESFEIWGDACGSPQGCFGPGQLKHRFSADGTSLHERGISINQNDPGPLVEKKYGNRDDDRYGVGQWPWGTTRVYAASAFNPATVNLSIANRDGSFRDVLTVGNSGNTRAAGAVIVGEPAMRGDPNPWNFRFGVHTKNPDGRWSHFPWSDGINYIRGRTNVDGPLCVENVCVNGGELQAMKNALAPR